MPTVQVRLKEARTSGYPVHIEPGLIHRAGKLLRKQFAGCNVFIISNPLVFGLWGRALEASLKGGGFSRPLWHLVKDGERHKSFKEYQKILAALAAWDRGLAAKPLVLLLGGGVLGDLGGFAAATYKRGIPFVQIPTTLLSMVDSSVGGKLGIDFDTPAGRVKNLVGCFAQPEAVLADPQCLATLHPRQLRSGLAELVKTAVLFDAPLFAKLEKNPARLLQADPAFLTPLIAAGVAHKASVVARDEFDRKGLRILLNLGHTFGHAVEAASGFRILHGEAVAFGMACAGDLASSEGLLTRRGEADRARLTVLLEALGFKLRLKGLALPAVLAALGHDKKFEGGARFVLPRALGHCVTHSMKKLAPAQAVLSARLR